MIRSFPEGMHPMTQLSIAVLALQLTVSLRKPIERYAKSMVGARWKVTHTHGTSSRSCSINLSLHVQIVSASYDSVLITLPTFVECWDTTVQV